MPERLDAEFRTGGAAGARDGKLIAQVARDLGSTTARSGTGSLVTAMRVRASMACLVMILLS